MSVQEVGELLDISNTTVRIGADRARTFNWPLPSESETELSDPGKASERVVRLMSWLITDIETEDDIPEQDSG